MNVKPYMRLDGIDSKFKLMIRISKVLTNHKYNYLIEPMKQKILSSNSLNDALIVAKDYVNIVNTSLK